MSGIVDVTYTWNPPADCPECEAETWTTQEDFDGNEIVVYDYQDSGDLYIYKISPDGRTEWEITEYADGSREERVIDYISDDGWDYTEEYIYMGADGSMSYEFTDAYGNT